MFLKVNFITMAPISTTQKQLKRGSENFWIIFQKDLEKGPKYSKQNLVVQNLPQNMSNGCRWNILGHKSTWKYFAFCGCFNLCLFCNKTLSTFDNCPFLSSENMRVRTIICILNWNSWSAAFIWVIFDSIKLTALLKVGQLT